MATGETAQYALPYPLPTDPVNVAGDIQQLATKIDDILQETIEDVASLQWTTGGTFSNGLTAPTYNDATGKMSMSLSQDLQTTATPTFTGLNLVGGDLYLGPSRAIIFEGSSDDGFETTFDITNPTADRTITFQNATGTVAYTSEASMTSLLNIASATGAITLQMGYGATTSGTTKAITIGNNGVSGSITNVSIGSSVAGALGTTTINSPTTSLLGDITIATGKSFQINSTSVLNATTLGSSVVNSSLTSVGTITSGTWQGSVISATYIDAAIARLASPTFTGTVTAAILDLTTAATATAATSYFVETGSDGIVRPKTLANVKTEIVTTAAVNAAAATTVGTVTSGTWQATAINATYIDTAIARLASPTFTGTPAAPTAAADTNTTQIATTAFVIGQGYLKTTTASSTYAPISSPTFTGLISSQGTQVLMNSDVTGTPSDNVSFTVERGTSDNVEIRWNETGDAWQFTNDGTTYYDIPTAVGGGMGLDSVMFLGCL
jgi:hypothetical protein